MYNAQNLSKAILHIIPSLKMLDTLVNNQISDWKWNVAPIVQAYVWRKTKCMVIIKFMPPRSAIQTLGLGQYGHKVNMY